MLLFSNSKFALTVKRWRTGLSRQRMDDCHCDCVARAALPHSLRRSWCRRRGGPPRGTSILTSAPRLALRLASRAVVARCACEQTAAACGNALNLPRRCFVARAGGHVMGKGGGGGLCVGLAAMCAFLLPSSDAAASRSAFLNKKSWHPGGFKQARLFTAPTRCVSHGLRAVPPTARGCVEARAGEGAGGEAAGGAEEADCRGARSARASPRRSGGWPCDVRAPRVRFASPVP